MIRATPLLCMTLILIGGCSRGAFTAADRGTANPVRVHEASAEFADVAEVDNTNSVTSGDESIAEASQVSDEIGDNVIGNDGGQCEFLDVSAASGLAFENLRTENGGQVSQNDLAKTFCKDDFKLLDSSFREKDGERVYSFTCRPNVVDDGHSRTTTAWRVDVALKDSDYGACAAKGMLLTTIGSVRYNGCFDPATMIRLAGGGEKRIDEIQAGEMVFNPVTGRAVKVDRIVIGEEADKPMYEIGFDNRIVLATEGHPFPTDHGVKTSMQLTDTDMLLGEDGHYYQITRLKKLPLKADQVVYNLELDMSVQAFDGHMLVANGIVAGDLFIQNELKK